MYFKALLNADEGVKLLAHNSSYSTRHLCTHSPALSPMPALRNRKKC